LYSVDCYASASDSCNRSFIQETVPEINYSECIHDVSDAQKLNMLNGLYRIATSGKIYDHILICRFDLIYKKTLLPFIQNTDCDISYAWKEVPISPNRVPDTLHWLNNDSGNVVFTTFVQAIETHQEHGVFHDLKNTTDRLGMSSSYMVSDGYYDSNTSRHPDNLKYKNLSLNPIYVFSGRRYFFDDFHHPTLFSGDWNCE
jgi:hypothetical protein